MLWVLICSPWFLKLLWPEAYKFRCWKLQLFLKGWKAIYRKNHHMAGWNISPKCKTFISSWVLLFGRNPSKCNDIFSSDLEATLRQLPLHTLDAPKLKETHSKSQLLPPKLVKKNSCSKRLPGLNPGNFIKWWFFRSWSHKEIVFCWLPGRQIL